MTKQEFDLKYRVRKVAVHCDTEEKAKAFLSLAKSFGFKWSSGNDLEKISYWGNCKENTCYRFFGTFVETFSKKHYETYDYTIVEFELEKETTKENDMEFKVGQKVRVKTDLKSDNLYDNILFSMKMEFARGKVFTIGSISHENAYTLSDFLHPDYLWSAKMLEPVEEKPFKVGDVVYAKKNGVELKVTETDLYRLETKDGTAWFMKKELLTHKKPLKKITKEQLAEMGYEVE